MTMATGKLPPNKRRKLSASTKPTFNFSPSIALSLTSAVLKNAPSSTCSSCHRHAQIVSKSSIVLCARCGSPTCTICSRICSASLPLPSHFPWSISPPYTTFGPSSHHFQQLSAHLPQRYALTNSPNTNTTGYVDNLSGKRKKSKDNLNCTTRVMNGNENEEAELGRSCGRTVCKSCCFESPQKKAREIKIQRKPAFSN
ncbi:hypothetical protein F5050DRAFT_1130506 [Lentinula boryana]|uniref:B box-type domain-containing protein n=1 Tax=Lentinula boryana TaxID=40481 RepID=A0ABQ8PYQ9_9AGAR|nr:hypothetical protein F5050DRAFT_1130506 [Lentinula boryana]